MQMHCDVISNHSGLGLRTTLSSPAIVLRSGRVTLSSCFHSAHYRDEGFSLSHTQDAVPQSSHKLVTIFIPISSVHSFHVSCRERCLVLEGGV